jgi:hypothetical protein
MFQILQRALQLHTETMDARCVEGISALRPRSTSHGLGGASSAFFEGQQSLQRPRNNPKSRTGLQKNKPLKDGTIPD